MTDTQSNEPYRIIAPEQYQQGYKEYLGMQIPNVEEHKFKVIRRLEDGNYLVENPAAILPTEGEG
jgi:hypothetical protein